MQLIYLIAIAVFTACLPSGLADESSERSGLTANELSRYIEQLTSQGRIITDLTVRVVGRVAVFDVTEQANKDGWPWLIQVNISDQQLRASSKQYTADGFTNTVHRFITNGRSRLHSTIWVQKADTDEVLKLPTARIPVTGDLGKDLEPLNELLLTTLAEKNIPGATVAVARNGAIVYERGFGYSDLKNKTPMAANTVMRIASISKPITAVAIMLLLEDGKLALDDSAINYIVRDKKFALPKDADPAWNRVTIRHLLQHSGGWDRDKSKDPMFELLEITRALQLKSTARIPDIIQYQLSRPMDFEPGSKYAYSNFGYSLLGRIIEVASGQSYESFVTDRILKPTGMTQTRLGRTRLNDRADDEAFYYTQQIKTYPAIWDIAPAKKSGKFESVAGPYGRWDLEVMDAHGAWTSTAVDLVRFAMALDSSKQPLLQPATLRLMKDRPSFASANDPTWYGFGWNIRSIQNRDRVNMWHNGLVSGTSTILVKRSDNYDWAVLFNTNETNDGKTCSSVIDGPIHSAVNRSFPDAD